MPRSPKRKPVQKPKPKGSAGISQRGFSKKLFRRRGQHVDPIDMARMILRVARSRGSQAVLRAERARYRLHDKAGILIPL